MELKVIEVAQKLFLGMSKDMSFANNTTPDLWRAFMPRRKEIQNVIGIELYSGEVYPNNFFISFNPSTPFQKWAAVEVENFDQVPARMETLISPAGLYAVFNYKGTNAGAAEFYRKIFTEWLPASAYQLDARPHWAVMGTKYKNNDPDSEEEIWIPVKLNNN